MQVEDATYAFVTSPSTNSTQVIDITNPSQPNPVSVLQDDAEYTNLNKPFNIESVQIDDAAYALVASRDSNGIQIIKLGYNITTQTPFSITSNNTNSSYAKAGDTVSIQITVNDTLDQSKSTVQIQNLICERVNKTSLYDSNSYNHTVIRGIISRTAINCKGAWFTVNIVHNYHMVCISD